MNNNHSVKKINIHDKKIKSEIHPKMIMIWTFENIVHFQSFKSP
jgi:hypothetical protein